MHGAAALWGVRNGLDRFGSSAPWSERGGVGKGKRQRGKGVERRPEEHASLWHAIIEYELTQTERARDRGERTSDL